MIAKSLICFCVATMAGCLPALAARDVAARDVAAGTPQVIEPGAMPGFEAERAVAVPGDKPALDSAAPMPDVDAAQPLAAAPTSEAGLAPAIYAPSRNGFRGDGFSAGSDSHSRNLQPATGVALNVPLN